VIHVTATDLPDLQVNKMIARASVTIGLELSETVDPTSCTDQVKEMVTILAAIYAIAYFSGVVASGLNYSIGDLSVSQSAATGYSGSLAILDRELKRLLEGAKDVEFRAVSA
jgi:hypothetical protein